MASVKPEAVSLHRTGYKCVFVALYYFYNIKIFETHFGLQHILDKIFI